MKLKIIIIVLFWPYVLMAYPWPMHDGLGTFNGPLAVSAALGDYRNTTGTAPRFHNGVDISAGAGTSVYSIESGVSVYPSGDPGVRTVGGNYAYVHLSDRIPVNRNIVGIIENASHPTTIGTVQSNHLHFIDGPGGGPYRNPIFGLDNYVDNNNPNVRNEIYFYKSKPELLSVNNRQQLTEYLYGKIDIRAQINDQLNTGVHGGIYGVTYEIQNLSGGLLYDPNTSVFFSQVKPPSDGEPVKYVYDITISQHANSSTFRYWVSNTVVNDVVEDRYWNSKLKVSEQWNGSDAYINSEAQTPDGPIRVKIEAWDMSNGRSTRIVEKLIDNFTPYVQELSVEAEGITKYKGQWPTVPESKTVLGVFKKEPNLSVPVGKVLTVKLVFNEVMKTTVNPTLVIVLPGSIRKPLPAGQWSDGLHYQTIVPENILPAGVDGICEVLISGAKDLAGNLLDRFPNTIACRDEAGAWTQYETGVDESHQFFIGTLYAPLVSKIDPVKLSNNVEIDKKIEITFSEPINPTTLNQSTVTFNPHLSGSFTQSWNSDTTKVTLALTDTLNDFELYQYYTVTLSDSIKDTSGVILDGDGDGKPGRPFITYFTTRRPKFKFPNKNVPFGPRPETKLVKAYLTNKEKRRLKIKVTEHDEINNGDWSINLIGFVGDPPLREIELDSMKTDTIKMYISHNTYGGKDDSLTFTALAYDPDDDRYLDTLINQKIYLQPLGGGNQPANPNNPPPAGEAGILPPGPDDNWSLSDPNYSTPWLIEDNSQAGLLLSGYYEGMGHLLGGYGLATVPVDEDLTVFSEQYNELDSIKALVIPSGGLRGKEYDGNFWQKLNSYVSNGGNLVVMAQPFGTLYSRLPGNPQARGWEEDLSCTGWFTRLASGHPASSGQRWIMNSYQTDGYFTWLPEQSQVITRRMLRGGAASTVAYPYGQGKVTLTTCYTDFGFNILFEIKPTIWPN